MEDLKKELKNLKTLMVENLEYSRKIQTDTRRIRKYIVSLQIINAIKLLLILIPLVLALIYLPPLMSRLIGNYKDVFQEIDQLKKGEIDQLDPSFLQKVLQ
jgi:hypothetical protein